MARGHLRLTARARALLLSFLLAGCAGARPVLVRDGVIEKRGYYRIAAPADWRPLRSLDRDTLTFAQMIVDAAFVRCPDTQTIEVGRASYRQKKADAGPDGERAFVAMAGVMLNELQDARMGAPARSDGHAEIISVGGARAARITYRSESAAGGFCEPLRPLGTVVDEYVVIDGGNRGLGLSNHAGIWAQKFVVIHLQSPEDGLGAGRAELNRLVASFAFDQ